MPQPIRATRIFMTGTTRRPSPIRDVTFKTVRLEAVNCGDLFAVIVQCFAGQSVYEMNPATSRAFRHLISLAFLRGSSVHHPCTLRRVLGIDKQSYPCRTVPWSKSGRFDQSQKQATRQATK